MTIEPLTIAILGGTGQAGRGLALRLDEGADAGVAGHLQADADLMVRLDVFLSRADANAAGGGGKLERGSRGKGGFSGRYVPGDEG